MMAYEHNHELVEWGLNFFSYNPVPSPEYYTGYEQQYHSDHSNIENDEVIAHLLQAQLSADSQSFVLQTPQAADHPPEPDYARSRYYCLPSHTIYYEYENGTEEKNHGGRSSSYSSPAQNSDDEDLYSSSLELTVDSTFDEQVAKRLKQMIPISHVPRINGELPTTEEVTSDYERLRNRLEFCGLSELKVQGDGNCQFRALSDQLYRSPEHHKFVRQQVVNQLQSQRQAYDGYVHMDYSDYLKKTSKSGAWGDHVTLQAAADLYGVKIVIVTSFKDTYYIDILPKVKKSKRVLYLSFWAEVHYNSIYPQHQTDTNMEGLALTKLSKKKWWSFTSRH